MLVGIPQPLRPGSRRSTWPRHCLVPSSCAKRCPCAKYARRLVEGPISDPRPRAFLRRHGRHGI
eukprot:2230585-Alexandrium_andersonii.AAC.1